METHRLALPAGYRLENYEIQGVLGKGGFGITYVAYDWTLGRHMAIKELLPDTIATRLEGSTVVAMSTAHEEGWRWARERFIEEARILAGFRHPNIIAVHRLIEANGTVYLVMDHLSGGSYEARLREIGKEPDQESLMRVIGPILDGLKDVHAAGLLHRDIKPENILFDNRENPVLIDFGAARAAVGATMTMTSIVTHGYSPAEQYQTKGKMGPWTDIYAMAAVMCRAISGEKPPVASDRMMEDDFLWLSERRLPGFYPAFLKAVDWALQVRPEDRPKSIEELIFSLVDQKQPEDTRPLNQPQPFSETRDVLPKISTPPESLRHKHGKPKWGLIVTVVGISLFGLLLVAGMVIQAREAERGAKTVLLQESQKAAEQLRKAQEAAAAAKREADEQARLAQEAEAARRAAEKQAQAAREAEAARIENERQTTEKTNINLERLSNLQLNEIITIPFRIRFTGSPDDGQTFTINSKDLSRRTQFLKIGDQIEGSPYKIVSYEKKSKALNQIEVDASELTIENTETGEKLVLVTKQEANAPTLFAKFHYPWNDSVFQVKKNDIFTLEPEPDRKFKLISISETEAIVQDVASGELVKVPKSGN
jgi:serine/threonine protein kinase